MVQKKASPQPATKQRRGNVDNASCHSVQVDRPPTTASRKAYIKEWLQRNDIQLSDNNLKDELLYLVRQHKPQPQYLIDQVARQAGHTVLRLPPYHSDLNPVELIWGQVKRHVAKNNETCTVVDVQQLIEEAFKTITVERWRSVCEHVMKVETDYWAIDIP